MIYFNFVIHFLLFHSLIASSIVQLFEWNWNSVAKECPIIAASGFQYIQVSPAQEHIVGTQWYTDYQPVSYQIKSKRGNLQQFQAMMTTCRGVGVGIIVDVILNLTGQTSGTGIGGSSFTKYNYQSVPYTYSNFHHCGLNGNDQIKNYNNAFEVQNCELVGLADLATDTTAVQQVQIAFLNNLINLGAAGVRIDGAKHINVGDLKTILSSSSSKFFFFFITQEVPFGNGEPIQPNQYEVIGSVIEFRATYTLSSAFSSSGSISNLINNYPGQGWVSNDKANPIMANQDTERNSGSVKFNSPNNAFNLAAVFLLSHSYGNPTIFSGYDFSSFEQGAPQDTNGLSLDVTCGINGFRCEHRSSIFAALNSFRAAVSGTDTRSFQSFGNQRIAFSRGNLGTVLINNQGDIWSAQLPGLSIPDGSYCDVLHGCSKSSPIIVAGGIASIKVLAYDAVILFVSPSTFSSPIFNSSTISSTTTSVSTIPSPTPTTNLVSVTFVEIANVSAGQTVILVGSISPLRNWNPKNGIPLTLSGSNRWTVTVSISPNTNFQYKFIKLSSNGQIQWESDPNRQFTTGKIAVEINSTF